MNIPAIDGFGTKYWYKNGFKHRGNDLPAVIRANGNKYWYKNGLFHRDNDKPAIIYSDGYKEWYKNGEKYYPPTPLEKLAKRLKCTFQE